MEIQALSSKVVLSLDDDVEVCALLEHLLWPHRVIGVAHAYVALELLAREAFDLFILDVNLPDMDGVELCQRIHAADPYVPIVFFSGIADPAEKMAAMNAGAAAYFAKPLDPEALRDGIEHLLRRAERRNEAAEREVREALRAPEGRQALALARAAGPDSDAASRLEGMSYRCFIAARGTRARFRKLWPTLLDDGLLEVNGATYIAAAAGGSR